MKKFVTVEGETGFQLQVDGDETIDIAHGDEFYGTAEVDAELAAKDAEIRHALHTIEALVAAGFVTQEKVDQARALMEKLGGPVAPHPDAARLDKLLQKSIDLPGFVKPDTTERVHFYENDFYPFSNFSAFRVRMFSVDHYFDFDTSEVAYHWFKFEGSPHIQELIMLARSSHEAFKIAESYRAQRRPDWDLVKVDVMRQIIRAKAEQHEYVRRKLLQTGDRELVEDSWRDEFWGWGPNRDGQNMLGKLWMEVRAELREAIDSHVAWSAKPTHICGARGFADTGDECPACKPRDGGAG